MLPRRRASSWAGTCASAPMTSPGTTSMTTATSSQGPMCQGHNFACNGLNKTGMQPATIESTN
eukprot:CAMPEP_0204044242 /NCGR_PEP_ID=MMETSP0360-20130528/104438_1 /ASSEMBLY_ACC=CAM_ASM_000342 /TAXON_ID=268821 /ORGANISM="Scrippsiella Hangoei, Strain SHTV-5" /LENGTH=62 /DNA_ID=CAMNT_0050990677 /DNA_START=64 /DNA_END=249 /DNA_ORIENTATION=+